MVEFQGTLQTDDLHHLENMDIAQKSLEEAKQSVKISGRSLEEAKKSIKIATFSIWVSVGLALLGIAFSLYISNKQTNVIKINSKQFDSLLNKIDKVNPNNDRRNKSQLQILPETIKLEILQPKALNIHGN